MRETTVDSLLKEIDNEMEQTKCNAMQKTVEGVPVTGSCHCRILATRPWKCW